MQRRTLLGFGLAGSLAVAVFGGTAAWMTRAPAWRSGTLTPAGRHVFSAVARAVLDGSLPTDPVLQSTALDAHLARLTSALAALPSFTQSQVDELVSLLAMPTGRRLLARLTPAWQEASNEAVQAALQSMRVSNWALRRQAYHALRDLTQGAYFADPATWPTLGYPGPRAIPAAAAP